MSASITISTIAGDDILNAVEAGSVLPISGTTSNVADGQTVSVGLNSKSYTTTVTNNAWTLDVPASDLTQNALPDGIYAVNAGITDPLNGTAITSQNLTVDETAPVVTAVLTHDTGASASDSITNNDTLNGSGDPNAVVTLTEAGTLLGTTVANGTGAWSFAPPSLSDGTHTIIASETDTAGNTGTVSLAFTLDTTVLAPSAPVLAAASDSGASNTDDITNVGLPTFTGTGEDGATVTLLDNTTTIGTGTVSAGGTWSITASTTLTEGGNSITATQTDVAGNTSTASGPLSVTLDTTPPAAPSAPVLAAASDSGASNSDDITNVGLPIFTGTGETGATVTLLDNTTTIGTGTVSAAGTWSITATTALTEGGNSITAEQTDPAGNPSTASTPLNVTLDTTPPAPPSAPVLAPTSDSGVSNSDDITNVGKPVFTGTGENGATVTLIDNTTTIGTGIVSAGTWSITAATTLTEGGNTITASQTDVAGNTSTASAPLNVTLDTTAPAPPSAPVLAPISDSGVSSSDDITNVGLPFFTGTGENGATVTLLDNTTTIGTGTVSAGTWSITATTALSQGANSITAEQTDPAGNTSTASTALHVTLDTIAPAPPSTPDLLTFSDSGASSTDNITNVSLPVFSGIGENGATVTLLDGNTTIGTGAVTDGTWSITATTPLTEGANSITATQTDVAGNTSVASTPLSVTLDTIAPVVTATLAHDTGASASDSITKNAALNGTGDDNAVVTLTEGATQLGTTIANGAGAWSFTPMLIDGLHTITASETDTAGNTGTVSVAFTLDTVAPAAPSAPVLAPISDSGISNTDDITNVGLPVFTGTGENGATVTLLDGSTTIGTGTVSAGTWSITAATALSEGANSITAEQTDVAGNISTASTPLNVTLDTTAPGAPSAPVLAAGSDSGASSSDDITNVGRPVFTGTGENGATVTLLDNTTTIGTGTVSAAGTWSITATTALSEGPNSITAEQTDPAGNPSVASAALSVTLDTTAPAPTSAPVLAAGSDSGVSSSDDITNVGLPVFTGTGENGATVTLLDNTTTIGTGIVSAGTWSITATTALSEGANSITAEQTDPAGNPSVASGPLNVTLDTTAPLVTAALAHDTGASGSDSITRNATLNGTGDASAKVTLTEGATQLGTTTADGTGAWSFTPTLTDGPHTITASETDTAGNTGSISVAFILDTVAPTAPGTPDLAPTSDSGTSNADGITNVRLPSFTGIGETGATVTLLDGSTTIGTGTVSAAGTWSITAATALSEGANSITAEQTDVAGNISTASTPLNVTLDTLAPGAPSTPDLLAFSDSGVSSTDNVTNVSRPIFNGVGENHATVTLLDGTITIGTGTVTGGTWSITAATALSEGANSITATQTDVAGNTSVASAPLSVTLDTIAPVVTAALAHDTGISSSDSITKTATLKGTGDANTVVTLTEGATTLGTTTADSSGAWTFTPSSLTDGPQTIIASETDTAGNTGSVSVGFTLDTAAPAAPSAPVLAAGSDSGASSSDDITNVGLPIFTGTGEDGATVTLLDNTTTIGTGIVSAGTWSITASTTLTEGVNSITAEQTDVAGNTSTASAPLSVTLDTIAPVVTAVLAHDTGASANDTITNNDTLNGTGDANALVTLKEGATQLGTTTANGTGAWSFTPTLLTDGQHTITASETDAAGNTGTVSLAFTLDTTVLAPSAPVLAPSSDSGVSTTDNVTNVGRPVFTGTGETGATVTLLDGSTTIGTGTVSAGTWSITAATALIEGANTITATQTDVAGNTSTASGPLNVTLDTTAPAAPSAPVLAPTSDSGASNSDDITNVGLPIFTGTGEDGATVTLLDNTTTIGTGIVSAGTWSITASTTLTEGVNSITAEQTDVAGNTSTASAPLSVTLDTIAPVVTAVLAHDTGASANDTITNNDTLNGTGDANALVTLKEGATQLGTTTANGTGAWSFTPTLLTDGQHTITASETDAAGNTGTVSLAFTLDTTVLAPSAPVLAPSSDSGVSTTDNVTNVGRPVFTGTGETGATVTLLDGSTTIGTGTVSAGTWSITATAPLIQGNNRITARQTDVAGNVSSASAPLNVTLDTIAPVVTAALTDDTGASASDKVTSDATLNGTGDADATVTLTEGATLLGTTIANGTGAWSFTPTLTDGDHTITASETDTAGNIGSASIAFNLDTDLPDAPSAPVLATTSDSGISDTDGITNVGRPRFSGTGEDGATVTLLDGSTAIGTDIVSGGAWSITATAALSEGSNSITAEQTDLAGNTSSASSPLSVTFDTIAPTVTAVTASPSNASVQVGQTVSFTIGLSEAVTVNATGGEPTLSLSDGATATYVSGSDTDALTFSYTVAAGQASTDLAVTGVNLNGSTITDAAGNAADLTGAAVNPPGTLTIAGVAPVAEFDAAYYLANNPDVAAAGVDPAEHYATVGWTEGRNPDAFFNTDYYLNQNPDVAAAGIDPLTHYETIGWKEGRDPSADFSTDAYLQANPDVAAAGIDPLLHYLEYGAPEGRMAFIAQPHGVGEQNPLVDNTYYFAQNPDVRAAGVNPFTQYDATGWHEGRNPDALFNTNYYLQQNPDVAAAGVDPLLHYEQYGWLEGRNPSPDFSTDAYLNANPDVKAAGINPLVQYEEYGIHEGRAIFHV